jgi:hypothetical protein
MHEEMPMGDGTGICTQWLNNFREAGRPQVRMFLGTSITAH